MLTDQQGNSMTGATAVAAALFDEAIDAYNIYRGDPVALLDAAAQAAPAMAMPYIAKAHLFASSSEPDAMAAAGSLVAEAKGLALNDRERSHVAALDLLVAGEWTEAAAALDRHNLRYPLDLLALQSGHLLDFFCANARNLRDRIARVLPYWSPNVPGYPIVLGMHAFGLEECNEYARAEDVGRQAVALQPLDCWAHHAVAHVMEMQGRPEDGIGWMIAREPYWAGDDNLFQVHNWWHRALFHLELGQDEEAIALYDIGVRADRSAVALQLIDASAMLWRLHLAGVDVGDRWVELAEAWRPHADGVTYPFNDWHAVMAFLGAGAERDVERVVAVLRSSATSSSEMGQWTALHALPLVEGFIAFWRGRYAAAAELLLKSRAIANVFGGSNAQRDIIDWTIAEAAVRGGIAPVAQGLANERVARKPHTPLTAKWLARIADLPAAEVRAA
jgi:tetratricopeptide (TPR) repeat protein